MKILCDTHVHTVNSFDGESTVLEMAEKAVELGLSAIAVTDHMEAPEIRLGADSQFGDMLRQIERSVREVEEISPRFEGKLKIYRGMELGEPTHQPKLTKKAMGIADFDFILASIHNLKDEEDFYYLDYSTQDIPRFLGRYFDELLDTAENADFDSLAHLTYPLRYIYERTDFRPDLDDYAEKIDAVLSALAKREKALEINTSGLFKTIGRTLPDINVIKRFRELGGKYVTIGSDAHRASDLAKGIEQGLKTARISGFEHFTIYENRRPKMIEIWY